MALAMSAATCIVSGMKTRSKISKEDEIRPAAGDGWIGPLCELCGGKTRLTGIEPHPQDDHTDLRSYECLMCGHPVAVEVPLMGAK
jgi:hypothetical protein